MKHEKEQLYKMNIYTLRSIARELGVKAPTCLKKQELIEEILQIESGAKQPCEASKK
ncbi:MAG: Rho termination factor N-terminal domain-containing protein [Clostridia bacterium]|nr:Rho termination factor N-terminal domain-containing protein [Clostridia bacterium]